MSTVQRVNFEPVTSILAQSVRSVVLAEKTLVNPNNAICLVDGEWMTYNASSQAVRATAIGSLNDPFTGSLCWAFWAEKGRYDLQAMGSPGAPLVYTGEYEADTRIFDASAAIGSGAAITTVGQPLKVATIAIGGRNFSGLVGSALNDNASIVGYVTRLPANNGGRLRFLRSWAVRNGTT